MVEWRVAEPRPAALISEMADRYPRSAPGWLTYVAFPYSLRLNPPRDVEVERLAGAGLLATLCEEPFDIDNPRHMALADEMQTAILPVKW
jgi:hypothetical protein